MHVGSGLGPRTGNTYALMHLDPEVAVGAQEGAASDQATESNNTDGSALSGVPVASTQALRGVAIPEAGERLGKGQGLSAWQQGAVSLTTETLIRVAKGLVDGPLYVSMPMGSGKTTGAVQAMVELVARFPEKRICYCARYTEAVDSVYESLVALVGEENVGRYYRENHGVSFKDAAEKTVLLITHASLSHHHDNLKERDLFIVDEAIYETSSAMLTFPDFATAKDLAERGDILRDEFRELFELIQKMDAELNNDKDKRFVLPQEKTDLVFARKILDAADKNILLLGMASYDLLFKVRVFCEALLRGQAYAFNNKKGTMSNKEFFAGGLSLPNNKKTVVLTATGGFVYNIAGGLRQDELVAKRFQRPDYTNLTLVKLSGPKPSGHYKGWGDTRKKDQVNSFIEHVIKAIPEKKIYVTVPKAVLDECLSGYFGPEDIRRDGKCLEFYREGKHIFVSHHDQKIGSNDFQSCTAVVYLWDNYKPRNVPFQVYYTLTGEPMTEAELAIANAKKTTGELQQMKNSLLAENLIQQLGRGCIRNIDDNGVAQKMTAYILVDHGFVEAKSFFSGAATEEFFVEDYASKRIHSRPGRIMEYLQKHKGRQKIPATEVNQELGFKISAYIKYLKNNWTYQNIGFEYVDGGKGRGNVGYFKAIG